MYTDRYPTIHLSFFIIEASLPLWVSVVDVCHNVALPTCEKMHSFDFSHPHHFSYPLLLCFPIPLWLQTVLAVLAASIAWAALCTLGPFDDVTPFILFIVQGQVMLTGIWVMVIIIWVMVIWVIAIIWITPNVLPLPTCFVMAFILIFLFFGF